MKLMHSVWDWLMAVGALLYREDHDDYLRGVEAKRELAQRIATGQVDGDPIRGRVEGRGRPG